MTTMQIVGGRRLRATGACALQIDGEVSTLADIAAHPLPIASGGARAVSIVRVIEQLDIARVYRLLLEARRVLAADGELTIELPDHEAVLARWARGEISDARAAAVFCAYRRVTPAFWGAPAIEPAMLRAWRDRGSPMRLAIDLEQAVVDRETGYRFERRNAWSRDELTALLQSVGFDVGRCTPGAAGTLVCVARPAVRLDERHYRWVWDVYTRRLRQRTPSQPAPSFVTDGRLVGVVPTAAIDAVRALLATAPIVRVTAADSAPGYLSNANLSPDAEVAINRDNQYLALGPPVLAAIAPVLEALAAPVRACLGTPWRVVNLRAWRTAAHADRIEANGWHRDEPYPEMVRKVLVYLSPASATTGTTEILHDTGERSIVVGPPGTFLVFKNLELIHRGVPPTTGERLILEITVAPHLVDDLRPVCAGQNADFPLLPWMPLEHLMENLCKTH